jgi:hypothetical protein
MRLKIRKKILYNLSFIVPLGIFVPAATSAWLQVLSCLFANFTTIVSSLSSSISIAFNDKEIFFLQRRQD